MSSGGSCPCKSGQAYSECCEPFHHGAAAPTPEALMRSRFCAFALNNVDYLNRTWHPGTCPAGLSLDKSQQWINLEILDAGEEGDRGFVHFRATCREKQGFFLLEEHSRFVREDGRWLYFDGDHEASVLEPGRNDPCPCGSGQKFKKCCGA